MGGRPPIPYYYLGTPEASSLPVLPGYPGGLPLPVLPGYLAAPPPPLPYYPGTWQPPPLSVLPGQQSPGGLNPDPRHERRMLPVVREGDGSTRGPYRAILGHIEVCLASFRLHLGSGWLYLRPPGTLWCLAGTRWRRPWRWLYVLSGHFTHFLATLMLYSQGLGHLLPRRQTLTSF